MNAIWRIAEQHGRRMMNERKMWPAREAVAGGVEPYEFHAQVTGSLYWICLTSKKDHEMSRKFHSHPTPGAPIGIPCCARICRGNLPRL